MSLAHVDLVVSSLERSLDFYRELLKPLGYTDAEPIEGERGERVVYVNGQRVPFAVGLRERQSHARHDRYAVGLHHLAFVARTRAQVDERAAWLRARGTEIESGPEEYPYTDGYYAVFFYDPDGIKLEVAHTPNV